MGDPRRSWPAYAACGVAAAALVAYGGASAVQHALMVTGAIAIPDALGEQASRWHLSLWDPWWVLGGALLWAAAGRAVVRGGPGR